ncbi:DUF411 domain-containing protein [Bradyrhizobium sp. 166]|uniref:DUF411 domain-containing protein n=1 Tax=Bradyrhizobium sp. 166 TaxID=2782638 RepID=UPI001FF99ECA|nr:DUF411 domain-containing protein [Bradyrhizobium sp. 166]MCK1606332.1 DUF411 domain-containing protein [Bradyrhizobium sp. 166]
MGEDANQITRRSLLGFIAAVSVGASTAGARADESAITVHKDPSCGCCAGWVQHLRDAGFKVRVEETSDLEPVRARLGVPSDLAACHTAEAGGYILEGHVPAAAVRRLLSERPNIRGLAVTGMPVGSPGMEGGRPQPYAVMSFGADGSRTFMRFLGSKAIG